MSSLFKLLLLENERIVFVSAVISFQSLGFSHAFYVTIQFPLLFAGFVTTNLAFENTV